MIKEFGKVNYENGTSLVAQMVKNPPAMQETWVLPRPSSVGKISWRRAWYFFLGTYEFPKKRVPVLQWDRVEEALVWN